MIRHACWCCATGILFQDSLGMMTDNIRVCLCAQLPWLNERRAERMLSVHACFLPLMPIRKDACVHSPCFFGRHDEGCCFEGHSMSLLSLLCAFSSPFGGKIQTLHTSEKDIIPTLHASLHCEHGRTVVTAVNGLPRVVIMNVAVWKGAPCP